LSGFLADWSYWILSASLQGGLALAVALLVLGSLPRFALVKVWILRVALLKLHLSAVVVGGISWTILSSQRRAVSDVGSQLSQVLTLVTSLAFSLWAVSVVIGMVRHWRARHALSALVREATPVDHPDVVSLYTSLCEQMHVAPAPRLLAQPATPSPLLIRNGHTSIVLPASILEPANWGHLEAAMAHELAHHRHGDLRWGWLLAITDLLFFFHPLAALALKKLRLCEECAADAAAMRVTGQSPSDYCRTLLSFAEASVGVSGVYAMADGALELDRRIKSLYDLRRPVRRAHLASAALVVAIALVGLIPWSVRLYTPGFSLPANLEASGAHPSRAMSSTERAD
jgi:beta-lactamase regulating signal transducer with metallopeptidase domain